MSEFNHSQDCKDPTCIECEDVCEYCDGSGMTEKQVDVDAFVKVPCDECNLEEA